MIEKFQLILKYIRYYFTALNGKGHGIHSPFIFDFVTHVLDKKQYQDPGFAKIERIRKELIDSQVQLEILDLGAGSKFGKSNIRTVGSIAKSAAKPAKYAQLLFRIVKHYKIQEVLELGTSLGLTTRYFALAQPENGIVTIEGAPSIAAFTQQKMVEEKISHVDINVGDFNDVLQPILQKMKGQKLVFVDGNHDEAATLAYFNQILEYVNDCDILVFDDIRWSEGMGNAWKEIKNNKEVTCSIDLFFIGIVLFRKEFKEKLHFAIRF